MIFEAKSRETASDSDYPFTEALVHNFDLHRLHNVIGLPTLIHPAIGAIHTGEARRVSVGDVRVSDCFSLSVSVQVPE
jgi:hypothetical protein